MSHDEPALDMGALDEAEPVTSDDEDSVNSSVEQDPSEMPTEGGMDVDLVSADSSEPEPDREPDDHAEADGDEQADSPDEAVGGVRAPEPTVHETQQKVMWAVGLNDYWPICDGLRDLDEESVLDGSFSLDGEQWRVEWVTYREGGLQVPEQYRDRHENKLPEPSVRLVGESQVEAPDGHEWDDPEVRGVTVQLKPKLPEARKASDGEIAGGIPDATPAGYGCEFDASNMTPDEVFAVWQAFLRGGLDLPSVAQQSGREDVHEWSRGGILAEYLRIDRELAVQRFAKHGLFDDLAAVATHSGGVGATVWNDRKVESHRDLVFLDQRTLSRLFGDDDAVPCGVMLKLYHPQQPRSSAVDPDEDPLRDPKLEVVWSPSKDSGGRRSQSGGAGVESVDIDLGNEPVPIDHPDRADIADIRSFLDRLLVNLCEWAGLLGSGADPWTPDCHFDAQVRRRDVSVVADPTRDVRREEQTVVQQTLHSGDLTPAQRAVIAHVVDEGQAHWSEIADEHDLAKSTVYDVRSALDDLLHVADGVLQTADDVVREEFRQAIDAFGGATEWLSGAVDDLDGRLDQAGVGDDSPLAQWARRHAVDVTVSGGVGPRSSEEMEVEITGQRPENRIKRLLRAGLDAARSSGQWSLFKQATFKWTTPNGEEVRQHAAGVWHGTKDEPNPYGVTVGTTR